MKHKRSLVRSIRIVICTQPWEFPGPGLLHPTQGSIDWTIGGGRYVRGHSTLGKSLQGTSPPKYHKIAIEMVFKTTYIMPYAADF